MIKSERSIEDLFFQIIIVAKKIVPYNIIFFLIFLSSCFGPRKSSSVFKRIVKDTTLQAIEFKKIEYKIQKNDLLKIVVSSFNPQDDAIMNGVGGTAFAGTTDDKGSSRSGGASGGGGKSASSDVGSILVDQEGCITLHRLGRFKVEGMTTKQLSMKIETELLPYLKEPIVTVEFTNHKAIIMGEVDGTREIQFQKDEKITIIEALALTGKSNQFADMKSVLVIRDTDSGKVFKHLNLEDHSIFTSPFYYLKKDDIVFVQTNNYEQKRYEKIESTTRTIQLASVVFGALTIILYVVNQTHL